MRTVKMSMRTVKMSTTTKRTVKMSNAYNKNIVYVLKSIYFSKGDGKNP